MFDTLKAWLCVMAGLWSALGVSTAVGGDKIRIVTTTTDLAAIARAVGGDHVEVTSLATGKEDPHFISAKPSYMMAARKADLWIRVGLELEIGYEALILDGSRNAKIRIGTPGHLDASEGVLRLEVPTQRIDRSMGDVHRWAIRITGPIRSTVGSSPSRSVAVWPRSRRPMPIISPTEPRPSACAG